MVKLYWFPNPNSFKCALKVDITGVIVVAQPDIHPTAGRVGQSFSLPDDTPFGHTGASLDMELNGYEPMHFRGILNKSEDGFGYINIDDVQGIKEKVCPDPIPVPPIPPNPSQPDPNLDPFTIIKAVYASGHYDLSTYDGCGQFTEACCTALHNQHSANWAHLQKFPPQNHYPTEPYTPGGKVHGVDVIQLLVRTVNTPADVFDIIINSESEEAEPAFNSKGPCVPNLGYYPAK